MRVAKGMHRVCSGQIARPPTTREGHERDLPWWDYRALEDATRSFDLPLRLRDGLRLA